MKNKLVTILALSLSLSGCSYIGGGSEVPSSSEITVSIPTEIGEDGCPIEEPCFEYDAEMEAMAKAMEEKAWATFDSYGFVPQNASHTIQTEYVGWTSASDAEKPQAPYWTIPSPDDHDVVFVFHSVALTTM